MGRESEGRKTDPVIYVGDMPPHKLNEEASKGVFSTKKPPALPEWWWCRGSLFGKLTREIFSRYMSLLLGWGGAAKVWFYDKCTALRASAFHFTQQKVSLSRTFYTVLYCIPDTQGSNGFQLLKEGVKGVKNSLFLEQASTDQEINSIFGLGHF